MLRRVMKVFDTGRVVLSGVKVVVLLKFNRAATTVAPLKRKKLASGRKAHVTIFAKAHQRRVIKKISLGNASMVAWFYGDITV